MAEQVGAPEDVALPAGLWAHQRDALEVIADYLRSGISDAAALITMPTGTGKTGVVGCASLLNQTGHTLVLAPRAAIANQLRADLASKFWEHVGTEAPAKAIRKLPSSSQLDELADAESSDVFVGTVQALETAMRTGDSEWALQLERVSLTIVDEGHYEPADEWSRAIRQLRKPTVLLTATPFRNDPKMFRLAKDHIFRFKHQEAEGGHFLRRPEFDRIEAATPGEFVDRLIERVDALDRDGAEPRVIVRCATGQGVRRMADLLIERGQRAVGIHDQFSAADPEYFRKAVPRTELAARYWVHQHKLVEGIDDPRFSVVAFYDVLNDDRAIVQQLGRALRNPDRPPDQTALVLSRTVDRAPERVWRAYERFEAQEGTNVVTVPHLVRAITESLPEAFYLDGGFKTPFDPDITDAWRDFAYPLRTQVFRWRGPDMPVLATLNHAIRREWEAEDRYLYDSLKPPDALLIPYVTTDNSPLLRLTTFVEPKFGYTLIRIIDKMLFYFDARSRVPEVIKESKWELLSPGRLHRLLPKTGATTLTSVSLLNTDLSRRAARARSLRAADIGELAPDLADHAFVCSTTEGYTGQYDGRHRRYLGLRNARVTDHRRGDSDFRRWDAWTIELAGALIGSREPTPVLNRFAKPVSIPKAPDPANVLIDVDTAKFASPNNEPLRLKDYALEVTAGKAALTANCERHEVDVSWDADRRRYNVAAPSLVAMGFRERDEPKRELVRAINEDQAIRLVPRGAETFYAHGRFFATPVPTGPEAAEHPWITIIEDLQELADAESEKGKRNQPDKPHDAWPSDSVFDLVDRLQHGGAAPKPFRDLFPSVDLLLCTDMGYEVADFVVAGADRIAFIHAKHGGGTKLSASVLQEVIGQALKNLPHLQPVEPPVPTRRDWFKEWNLGEEYEPVGRQRVGAYKDVDELWTAMRDVITDPNTQREVWLLLGQALSKTDLVDDLQSDDTSPQTIQIYALLHNAWAACQQLGVRLRVFCSP